MENEYNKVNVLYRSLAKYYGIKLKYGYITKLAKRIGEDEPLLNNPASYHTWKKRGYLPNDIIDIFLELPIPKSIKDLCKNCKNLPPQTPASAPEATNGDKEELTPSQFDNFEKTLGDLIGTFKELADEIPEMRDKIRELEAECERLKEIIAHQKVS